jgi:O-antigen/teichoic acid export membrane protein
MSSSLKKVILFRNITEYDNRKIIVPTLALEETEPDDRDTPADLAVAFQTDESLALELFALDVDQIPTQAGLQAILMSSSWSSPLTNGVPIYNQPTWRLPVLPGSNTVSIQASSSAAQTTGGESDLGLIRNLVKSSGVYAISAVASPLVSLVLAPFLTHSLSNADYGALIVLNTVITLVTTITQLGLNSAILRAYNYDYENRRDRLDVLSTALILLTLISISVAIVTMLTAPEMASFLLGSPSFSIPVQITALAILAQNLSVPGFAWLRAENRAKVFSILAIINLLITLGANIVLVGIAHMGIAGSLLATVAGYAVVMICMLPTILLRAGLALRLDITRNLLSFGIPLVFNSVSFWVLQLSDRYLLSRLGSLAQTASYGVAYTLGGALNAVVLAPFILAWPIAMYTIAKRSDAPLVFQLVFRWFSMILLLAAFVLALVAVIILNIFFPPSYHSAAPIIPIIAMSTMFFGVYNIFAVGIGIRRKTWLAALIMTLSALVNVGCNLFLIPLYGSMGAALSTLIAYMLLALTMYIVNQQIYPIPFEIGLFGLALLVGIAAYIGINFLAQHQTIYGACSLYIGSTVLYGGFLALLGKLPARNHKHKRQYTREGLIS